MPLDSPIFGHIDGVPLGSVFKDRRELYDANVHRDIQGGIVGRKSTGAESIVMSGGYPDDKDLGFEITYTGRGGQDPATKKQIADQDPNSRGNIALIKSVETGIPVRVIRGAGLDSDLAPSEGLRYDGLYVVTKHWMAQGIEGFQMCFYRLLFVDAAEEWVKVDVAEPPSTRPAKPNGSPSPGWITSTVRKPTRSSAVVGWVKAIHDYTCQICGVRITLRGMPYAEGAHIRPLGSPHTGPDVPENVLCLCPNCHIQYDHGEIRIDQQYRVTGGVIPPGLLRRVDIHAVDKVQIEYHDSIHFAAPAPGVRSS
jgi:putative restriction endonuclease